MILCVLYSPWNWVDWYKLNSDDPEILKFVNTSYTKYSVHKIVMGNPNWRGQTGCVDLIPDMYIYVLLAVLSAKSVPQCPSLFTHKRPDIRPRQSNSDETCGTLCDLHNYFWVETKPTKYLDCAPLWPPGVIFLELAPKSGSMSPPYNGDNRSSLPLRWTSLTWQPTKSCSR